MAGGAVAVRGTDGGRQIWFVAERVVIEPNCQRPLVLSFRQVCQLQTLGRVGRSGFALANRLQTPKEGNERFKILQVHRSVAANVGKFCRRAVFGQGLLELAHMFQSPTVIIVVPADPRAQLDGFPSGGDPLVPFPLPLQQPGEIPVSIGIVGGQLNGDAKLGNGVVQLILFRQGQADVVVDPRPLRINRNGLAKHGDRLVPMLLVVQGTAQFHVDPGILGVGFDAPAQGSNGVVQPVVDFQGLAALQIDPGGGLRIEFHCFLKSGIGLVQQASSLQGKA